MRCMIVALTQAQGRPWLEWVEDQHEAWQGCICLEVTQAYAALCGAYHEVCLLCPCPEADRLARLLEKRPPMAPPWVIRAGEPLPRGMPPAAVQRLPHRL